jgi:hypothetical protein
MVGKFILLLFFSHSISKNKCSQHNRVEEEEEDDDDKEEDTDIKHFQFSLLIPFLLLL